MHTSILYPNEHEYAAKVVTNNGNSVSGGGIGDNSDCRNNSGNSVHLLCTEHMVSDPQYGVNGNCVTVASAITGNNYYDGDNTTCKLPMSSTSSSSSSSGRGSSIATDSSTNSRSGGGDCPNTYFNPNMRNGFTHVNKAALDPTFLEDRCLDNLLKSEVKSAAVHSYFSSVQKEITPEMRRIVVEWMMEVCEEQKCQEEVVLLALNYMDRFLAAMIVGKTHLQILATSCLLLASKLREPSCRGLSADLLVLYTDNSIVKRDLLNWELYVLSKLKWDLSCVTPLDFLELLLSRLPITSKKCPDISKEKVRQHSQAFIWLTAKEHCFSVFSPSTIAASSIAAALSGLNWHLRTGIDLEYLLNRLTDLIGVEQEFLRKCMNKMEYVFREHSRNILSFSASTVDNSHHQANLGCSNSNNNNNNTNSHTYSSTKTLPITTTSSLSTPSPYQQHHQHHNTNNSSAFSSNGNTHSRIDIEKHKREAGTPTDVQDLKF